MDQSTEDDVAPAVAAPQDWDPSLINIESQGEIIAVVEAATVTQTLDTLRSKYGDDAPAIDPLTRPAQEQAWMSPSEAQAEAQVHCESERLLYPNRCVILGVTATGMGLALYCADSKGEEEPGLPPMEEEEKDENEMGKVNIAAKKMLIWYDRYAKCNLAFRYKLEFMRIECAAYQTHVEQTLRHFVQTPKDVERVLEYIMDQTRVDFHLRDVVRNLGPLVNAQRKDLRVTPRPDRPALVTPTHGIWPIQRACHTDPDPDLLTCWTLHVCRGGPWKEQRKVKVHTWAKTAPLSALNDTHLMLLYQSALTTLTHRVYSLCEESGAIKLVAEQNWRADALPRQMMVGKRSTHGSLSLCPKGTGNCALAMQSAVAVWNVFDVAGEDAVVVALEGREISAVHIIDDALTMGTTLGESYTLNWRTAELLAYDALRAIEPVWAVRFRPLAKARFMLSVMGVTLCAPFDAKMLSMDRPVAMDTCGGLIYVVSKYGFINVFDMYTRRVCHTFPPPEASAKTPLLQHCYQGVRATPDALYVIYPGGCVRTIKLGKKK